MSARRVTKALKVEEAGKPLKDWKELPLLVTVKTLVARIKRSASLCDRLQSLQKAELDLGEDGGEQDQDADNPALLHPLSLVNYVITRWSSAFYMMQRVVKLRRFIAVLLAEDPGLPQLSAADWTTLEELLLLLGPFAKATKELEGDKYPTLPRVWMWLHRLRDVCNNPRLATFSATTRAVRDGLLREMDDDRDNGGIKVDDMLRAAAAADPTTKVCVPGAACAQFFDFCTLRMFRAVTVVAGRGGRRGCRGDRACVGGSGGDCGGQRGCTCAAEGTCCCGGSCCRGEGGTRGCRRPREAPTQALAPRRCRRRSQRRSCAG